MKFSINRNVSYLKGTLGLTILLDQIPRNIFRGSARPFVEFDPLAIDTARYCINRKWDERLGPIQRAFIYLVFILQYFCSIINNISQ